MGRRKTGEIENFKVDVDLFGMTADICLGSFEDTKKYVDSEYDVNLNWDMYFSCSDGVLIDLEADFKISCTLVIAIKNFYDMMKEDMPYALNILSHECLHAATSIMDDRGVPVNRENDEVIAYVQSFLVNKIIDGLAEQGFKITLEEER